jgi:hypothetical protein
LLCKECLDIFSLSEEKEKMRSCGKCGGKYTDGIIYAMYWGNCIPIQLCTNDIIETIHNYDKNSKMDIKAFTISKKSPTMKKLK